ncbi:Threonine dehydratase [Quillaja saponaria]|uniref:threonine ammonia-lyase n=1 Tax=Quillaja saponaria TaxID=32244 RepID=A0AAD7VM54_QUISA|nr:Threonine dehydratase [Quillaja saponaria]
MESLCLTPTPNGTPLHRTTGNHSRFSLINRTLNQTQHKKKHLIKLSVTATLLSKNGAVHTMPITPPKTAPYEPSSDPTSSNDVPFNQLMIVSADSLQYESGFLGAVPADNNSVPTAGDGIHNAMSYLTGILSSKVYDVAIESILDCAPKISERLGVHVWLKREDLQPVFSFKLRGAYNMMAKLPREQLAKGVICSSAGNHAQGVALSAQKLNCDAIIVMPVTTPEIKWKTVKRLGATVVLGTIGMEIVRQMPDPVHAIFVPVGGGGLIAGIAAYVKRVLPEVKIIGVEPYDANAMALSLHHGQRVMVDHVGGFADGVAVKEVGKETFRLCRELIDGVVLVSRDAICASIKDMFEENRSILEPAGALAIAGAEAYCKFYGLKGENVVAITSGANMNFDRLRLVAQLADVGRRHEAVLATFIQEKLGNFKQFCEQVGALRITKLIYRYNVNKEEALVLYSVGFHSVSELSELLNRMESAQLETFDLTNNDLVKDHWQFLVGGQSNVENEILVQFVFPEKPGALLRFLDAFSQRWNISLFHYHGQGESGANVLVGFQVVISEIDCFKVVANRLGYNYEFETSNEILQLLLH